MIFFLNFVGFLLFNVICYSFGVTICPEKCTCKEVPQKDKIVWTKVRCGDGEKIKHLDELDLLNIASEIGTLNLSGNYLTSFKPKIQFLALKRLDLSRNKIEVLENKQFEEVPNLLRLDISNNNVKLIEPEALLGLKYLERLKLNQNLIATIQKGTFKTLTGLKQLDISNNPLTCDCELLWLLEWTQKQSVKIVSNPKCSSPAAFKGVPLRKLKIGSDIHCKSPAGDREIPMIDLLVKNDQILFEGDSFKLKCISPYIPDVYQTEIKTNLIWFWKDEEGEGDDVSKNITRTYEKNDRFFYENGLIESEIFIKSVNRNYSGSLNCQRYTNEGNFTKSINLIVISKSSKFCETVSTFTNKGNYFWPKTITNNTVFLPCEFIQISGNVTEQKTFYFCSGQGKWENLNTSLCSYTSETTRILEQFSKVNLSLNRGNLLESARHFRSYTNNLEILKDPMDLVYLIRTIENYLNYLSFDKELGDILIEIINSLMSLPENYLRKANEIDESCRKIVRAIEEIVKNNNTSSLHKNKIAAEEFSIKKETFAGMTCSWYSSSSNVSDQVFYCVTSSASTISPGMLNRKIEASVKIPDSFFVQSRQFDYNNNNKSVEIERLLIVMLSDARLFPLTEPKTSKIITLPVVGVKLLADNATSINLTDPIFVMVRVPQTYYDAISSVPVRWDEESNAWTSDGCRFNQEVNDNLIFSCDRLGYYAYLEDVTKYDVVETGAKFKPSHPAIYIGSLVLFVSLLLTVTTYAFCYVFIQMPKKAKHSLINLWTAVLILIYVYVFGIRQTEDTLLCEIIGLSLHYLTLCSILWMVVAASTMYRRLNKSDAIDLNEDELPSDQPIQKPILGLYLVGWGIALIVCGISSAVNMKEYAAYSFCFLNSPPALSALFVPVVILYLLLFVLYVLIRCTIYNTDSNGHLSEGTQATENVDLDLLEPNFQNNNDRNSSILSVRTRSTEMEDQERSPSAQLKAHVIFLLIYTCAWLCCAFATATPFKIEREEEIFGILYAIFASIAGGFTFFFYCVARSDVRSRWLSCRKRKNTTSSYFRTRHVSDASPQNIRIQPLPSVLVVGGEQNVEIAHVAQSRSSSRSSTKTKSNQQCGNNLVNLNVKVSNVKKQPLKFDEDEETKINNVNLVLLQNQQYRIGLPLPLPLPLAASNVVENNPSGSVQMFYNPYQSTVARKFFRKQRQHNMMKRNNFPVVRKCDSDTTSVISIPKTAAKNNDAQQMFGTNSKVNNTNIHIRCVERTKKMRQQHHRNPNIYSDSFEDLSLPIDKMAINSERTKRREYLRHRTKKKQNVMVTSLIPDMRTVSQQCSLEYTSDTSAHQPLEDTSDNNVINVDEENDDDVDEEVVDESNKSSLVEFKPDLTSVSFKRAQSRASSFSASELDELYQQIRMGPGSGSRSTRAKAKAKARKYFRGRSPCLSDSEIHSYVDESTRNNRNNTINIYSLSEFDDSNVETTV